MPIAHICIDCGEDLTRTCGTWDPEYRLRVIVCPSCRRGVVRRRHPLSRAWRTLRRVDWALTLLVVNLGLLAGLVVTSVGSLMALTEQARQTSLTRTLAEHTELAGVTCGVIPIVSGAALVVCLGHWRRAAAWCAFYGSVAAIIGGFVLLVIVSAHLGPDATQPRRPVETIQVGSTTITVPQPPPMSMPSSPEEVRAQMFDIGVLAAILLAVSIPISLAGIPAGLFVRRTLQRVERAVRIARCRRRRTMR